MKLLCIDYGMKRIGLATSDISQTIATPLLTMPNKGDKNNIARLRDVCTQHKIGKIVIGLPLGADGVETQISAVVREFAKNLRAQLSLPVDFVNEHLSSWSAEEHIRQNLGITDHRKIKELVDKMAAAMLLQDYLMKEVKIE